MAKTLKNMLEVYAPRSKDEKRFKDKHIIAKSKLDDKGTQDDKLFNATNVKTVERSPEHGYDVEKDEEVYESTHPMALHVKPVKVNGKTKYKVHKVGKDLEDGIKVGEHLSDNDLDDAQEMGAKIKHLTEKHLTPAEMKARERIAKGIEKSNPDMPMGKKMAIATASAKKVAEEVEELDEISATTARSYLDKVKAKHGGKFTDLPKKRKTGVVMAHDIMFNDTDKRDRKYSKDNMKEELEGLDESENAHMVFQKNHEDAAKSIKGITKALSQHYDLITDKKNSNKGEAGWHHVERIKDINRKLSDLHDDILRSNDYSKPIKLGEDVDLDEDTDLSDLLAIIYENLSDENKEIFEDILDNDPDQMVDFLEQLELHYGE